MQCIALVQPTPNSPEVAIIRFDGQDHDVLHKDPLAFVNRNQIFRKDVSNVEIAPHGKAEFANAAVVHWPSCTCVVYCIQS